MGPQNNMGLGIVSMSMLFIHDQVVVEAEVVAEAVVEGGEIVSSSIMYIYHYNIIYILYIFIYLKKKVYFFIISPKICS